MPERCEESFLPKKNLPLAPPSILLFFVYVVWRMSFAVYTLGSSDNGPGAEDNVTLCMRAGVTASLAAQGHRGCLQTRK